MLTNERFFGANTTTFGSGLFGFGVGVATERGQGWMRLKRVSPMPPLADFVAKLAMSTSFAALIVTALFALGATLGGARMPAEQWVGFGAVLVIGALPSCAMGLAFGYLVGPNSAPAVLNLVHMPMALGSRLWIPLSQLPEVVQASAPFMPPYHLAQLALGTFGAADGGNPLLLGSLAAFTVGFLAVAR